MPVNTNRFFLNALRDDRRALPTPDTGRWKDDSVAKDFLVKYAQDVHMTGEIQDSHAAHSVPSLYARPIQFDQALADAGNPLHKTIVGEWRGLLAIVALQQYAGLNLNASPVDVPNLNEDATSEVGSVGIGSLHLDTMLHNQLPRDKKDWQRWWMIYCDDRLIGATSPWTMIYTPAQYSCPSNVPWQEEGILYDPIRKYDPRGNGKSLELSLLERWVALTLAERQQRWGIPERLEGRVNVIARELAAWARDLNRYADQTLKVTEFAGAKLIDEAPFNAFLRAANAKSTPKNSDLLLKSSKLGETRNVLALAPSKINGTDRIQDFVLAEQLDFHAIRRKGSEGRSFATRNGKEINLEYVFVEDVFFPAKLMRLSLSDKALRRGTDNYSLPLTPAFFKYFEHDELQSQPDMLSVATNDKTVRVTLRLPLRSGKQLTIDKVYDREKDTKEISPKPVFALWPDFYAADWEENYAAYVANVGVDQENFQVAPLFSDGTSADIAAVPHTTQKDLRIWRCPTAPIGFTVKYLDKQTNVINEAGTLLRDRLVAPPGLIESNNWEVGVDFGTSSTTIYVRKNQHEPELLPVKARLQYLTDSIPDLMTKVADNLYPNETVMPPFRTLLYDSQATPIGNHARFTMRFKFSPVEVIPPYGNVKWAVRAGKADTGPLTEYLEGLVRYIAAEARAEGVADLQFHWSYPLSLPAGILTGMRDFWKSVANSYSRAAALATASSARFMRVSAGEGVSESEALCRCLADLKGLNVHARGLTVAVDVGGGSTDIGFWSSRDLLGQFSFKLAGNDVMTPSWLGFPDFLRKLYHLCAGADLPVSEAGYVIDRATVYLNYLLGNAKDSTGRLYAGLDPRFHPVPLAIHRGPAGDAPWLQIRSLAYIFYAGIGFYLGLYCRRFSLGIGEMKVYFGGRGSAFLSWISADQNRIALFLKKAIELGLKQQLGPTEGIAADEPTKLNTAELIGPPLLFSHSLPPMKHEVALGLEKAAFSSKIRHGDKTQVGEKKWKLNGQEVEWSKEVTADELASLTAPSMSDFDSTFLAVFLGFLKQESDLNLDLAGFKGLKIESASIEGCVRKTSNESQEVQPVFACELRSLMEQYVSNAIGAKATGASDGAKASTTA